MLTHKKRERKGERVRDKDTQREKYKDTCPGVIKDIDVGDQPNSHPTRPHTHIKINFPIFFWVVAVGGPACQPN